MSKKLIQHGAELLLRECAADLSQCRPRSPAQKGDSSYYEFERKMQALEEAVEYFKAVCIIHGNGSEGKP